ncbi:WbqC family protein [Candidatus Formimonas warabiya]|nr:WbqC family protein [Candidatus Formimonas warabiya]
MKLAVHQPNYLPWPGYFSKMARCDIFVILDTVQFPRGCSVANRNLIKTPQGSQMLTIPVKRKGLGLQRYADVLVLPGWEKKHLQALRLNYAKAPYFAEIFPRLESLPDREYLWLINYDFIRLVYDLLRLETKLVFLSSFPQFADRDKNERIVALCRHFSADSYLSGTGGAAYHQPETFEKHGLKLEYLDYQPIPYPQLWGNFIPNLSIVDLLFNCGAERTRDLLLKGGQE